MHKARGQQRQSTCNRQGNQPAYNRHWEFTTYGSVHNADTVTPTTEPKQTREPDCSYMTYPRWTQLTTVHKLENPTVATDEPHMATTDHRPQIRNPTVAT